MPFSHETLSTINLIVQAILLLTVLLAAWQARKKRLIKHCKIVNVVMVVQLIAVFLVMAPSFLSLSQNVSAPLFFHVEARLHLSLGLLIVLLWLYVNLAVRGRVRVFGQLKTYMRTALVAWVLTFVLGVHLYLLLYVLT
ncbi:MAG: hypothetical protein HYX80_06715 [Chloroflexi bacterium]|nr:hypothetical protein [Chloroflexota bacterium]